MSKRRNRVKKITIKQIKGLTIENRISQLKAIPDDVLVELKSCDVILKGPTTTPQKGDGYPNIESANVAMRRELDLFACVRPVQVPQKISIGFSLEKILKGPTCLDQKELIWMASVSTLK